MARQLHDTGEEAILKDFFTGGITKPATLTVSLFNDTTDLLTDTDDLAAITTEPSGTGYARQTVNIDGSTTLHVTAADNAGDWEVTFDDQTFDTSNVSSGTVDSYFVVINFLSADTGDTAAADHLFFTGALDQSYDLASITSFTLKNAGLSLT